MFTTFFLLHVTNVPMKLQTALHSLSTVYSSHFLKIQSFIVLVVIFVYWLWWQLFLACDDFGSMFEHYSLLAPFFFLMDINYLLAQAHWFYSLCQGQSTLAQQPEMTVAKCSPISVTVSLGAVSVTFSWISRWMAASATNISPVQSNYCSHYGLFFFCVCVLVCFAFWKWWISMLIQVR